MAFFDRPGEPTLAEQGFSSRQVCRITGLTARQLQYWQRTGLLAPAQRTTGGHARYGFTDLIVLKSARRLLDAGISLQRIRRCLQTLQNFLPGAKAPLRELSLVVTGDIILVLHHGGAFDALTGQEWILPVADILEEIESMQSGGEYRPVQWELFGTTEGPEQGAYRRNRG